jgi:hypothetical protein
MKEGLPGGTLGVSSRSELEEARLLLHAGLDLSRRKIDVPAVAEEAIER